MNLFLDSFWRAAAYCLHPRIVWLSLLPLILLVCLTSALGYFFWEPAMDAIRSALESSALINSAWSLLESWGMGSFKSVLPMLIILAIATPAIVVLSVVAVALLMTPAIVGLIARRRFPNLDKRGRASVARSAWWSLGSSLLALVATVLTFPLWLIPPLILVLPPLIWGWLTFRVMSFDALDYHATDEERRTIMQKHRLYLLCIGVITGYLGASPSLLWSFGVGTLVMAPFLVPISIWVYTLVFAFSALWFSHYCLSALRDLRKVSAS